MKFPYHVVHNGVSYPIGTDVPIEETNGGLNAPVKVSGKDDVVKEEERPRKYSEEDLKVPYFSLKAMAEKEGIKLPEKPSGRDIKELLRAL
jgi:hypothetical protein